MKSRSSLTPVSVVQSFQHFAQSTAVILPCSVKNFKTYKQMIGKQDFARFEFTMSFRWISYIAQHPWFLALALPGQQQLIDWLCKIKWFLSSIRKDLTSLAPGRSECDSKNVIFNLVLLTDISRSSHDNALRWMPQDLTDAKSTLVQVMAWCRQATSHYLSQCWPRSLSPHGVTRPQWVKLPAALHLSIEKW